MFPLCLYSMHVGNNYMYNFLNYQLQQLSANAVLEGHISLKLSNTLKFGIYICVSPSVTINNAACSLKK